MAFRSQFKTNVPDIVPYYQQSDIVLFPSLMTEGFGFTAVEAMACGKPVIWFDQPAIREATNGIGKAVPQGNTEALVKAMTELASNPDLRKEIGQQGLDYVKEHLQWSNVWTQYEIIFERASSPSAMEKQSKPMNQITTSIGTSHWTTAWTRSEIHEQLKELLQLVADDLPQDRNARIVIKPNLNNDLNGLTGNSVDLRVLDAIISQLKTFEYQNICVADGPNVGIARRGIDVFKRLGVRALCDTHGIDLVDLNADLGIPFSLAAGAEPKVARTILDADYIISVPKIKTHCEAMLSCAMKNWVGICVGQDKRDMHLDLGQNIALLNAHVKPDLVIVDGIIGMEGNGPGDGSPVALKQLVVSTNAHLNDLVVANLMEIPILDIPYLAHALTIGDISDDLCNTVAQAVQSLYHIQMPPETETCSLV